MPIRDIWYCFCLQNSMVIVDAAGEFRVPKTLDGLKDRLALQGFFRVHRSYLVNLQHVRSIITWSRNAYTLRLDCDREVPLSKHRIGALRRMLDW